MDAIYELILWDLFYCKKMYETQSIWEKEKPIIWNDEFSSKSNQFNLKPIQQQHNHMKDRKRTTVFPASKVTSHFLRHSVVSLRLH